MSNIKNVIRKRGSSKVNQNSENINFFDLLKSHKINQNSSSIIDHQSEWNGGYNPTSEGTGLTLPRGINPQDMKPEQLNLEPKKPEEIKICCCSSRDLFHFGCRCGGK